MGCFKSQYFFLDSAQSHIKLAEPSKLKQFQTGPHRANLTCFSVLIGFYK